MFGFNLKAPHDQFVVMQCKLPNARATCTTQILIADYMPERQFQFQKHTKTKKNNIGWKLSILSCIAARHAYIMPE